MIDKDYFKEESQKYFNEAFDLGATINIDYAREPEYNVIIMNNPNAFLLGCTIDSMDAAPTIWMVPHTLELKLGSFDIDLLSQQSLEFYQETLCEVGIHYWKRKANVFLHNVKVLKEKYNSDAEAIWKKHKTAAGFSAEILANFKGVGPKIAAMVPNLLYRDFHYKFEDMSGSLIPVDTHIRCLMERTGLIPTLKNPAGKPVSDNIVRVYAENITKEMNPEFPGMFDAYMWYISNNFCAKRNPKCTLCPLNAACPKHNK